MISLCLMRTFFCLTWVIEIIKLNSHKNFDYLNLVKDDKK